MAKSKSKPSKKVLDDDDEPQIADDDDVDVDADTDADVNEEPDADVDTDADADDEPADLDDADEDALDEDDGDSETRGEPAELPPPKAGLTKLTITLIFLNWLAALAFIVVAFKDLTIRSHYGYLATLNHIQIWGLPLDEEEGQANVSLQTRPVLRLSHDQLAKVYKSRPGTISNREKFVPVEEPVPVHLTKYDINERVMKDVFQTMPNPVPTLDAEIERLKGALPTAIEQAANDVLKKTKDTEPAKREVVVKSLLPIARNLVQIRDLAKILLAKKGKELDDLVVESVQRRLYHDILAPINVFRPGDIAASAANKHPVDRIADIEKMKLDDVKAMLKKRLDGAIASTVDTDVHLGEVYEKEKLGADAMKRSGVEKRQIIGFILFTVGHVQIPITNERLIPNGVERAQVVSGIYENTNASIRFVEALRVLQDRIAEAAVADRQGYIIPDKKNPGKITRTEGFIDEYEDWIDRLVKIVEHIDTAKKRLEDVKTQRDHLQKVHTHRAKQLQDTLDKLLTARKNTERYAKDLRELQEQLHAALIELSDAADRNFRLHDMIREIELGMRVKTKKKGGNQP